MKPHNPTRVLAIYRHYWPDTTPYAHILKVILERLAHQGAEVTVYTGQPTYNDNDIPSQLCREVIEGVLVRRAGTLPERKHWRAVRAFNAAWFLMRSVLHATFVCRYDVVIANSHPPVLIGVALRAIRLLTGARYVLHLQDLHPEASQAICAGRPAMGYNAALAIEAANCRQAARLVTLSTDMVAAIKKRGLPTEHVRLINNCPLPAEPAATKLPPCVTDESVTRFLFAGNLGRFQNLEALVTACHLLADRDDWRLVLMGAGALSESLTELSGPLLDRKIFLVGPQPVSTAAAAMRSCDYGVVSLARGVSRFAFPSKASTYLANQCPLLAVVESDSDLGQMISTNDLGIVSHGFEAQAIAEAMTRAIEARPRWRPDQCDRLSNFAEALFGVSAMLEKWDAVWRELRVLPTKPSLPNTPSQAA